MFTIFINYALLRAGCQVGILGLVFAFVVLIPLDYIVLIALFGNKNSNENDTDYNAGYHDVDWNKNGKIDWWEK